jgi:predicted DNA-binding transcriptional regulator YafY
MTKTSLLIEMIKLLRNRPGITVPELANALGRSERTIYRWLSEVYRNLRMQVVCRDGGYYLADDEQIRNVKLTPQELLALRLSLKASPFGEESPIGKWASSAWHKIRDASPWQDLQAMNEVLETHSVQLTAPQAQSGIRPGVVEAIEHAIESRRRVRALYRSQKSAKVKKYTLDPYGVAFRRHSWYVVAFSAEHNKVVQLKLVRFISVSETGETFVPPEGFSVDKFFQSSWECWAGGEPTKVRVRFSPRVAPLISEVRRHPTQVIHDQPDGSIIFEAEVAGIQEIAVWIMGWGKEAVVLEPDALREYVLEQARGMLKAYSRAQIECPSSYMSEREPVSLSAASAKQDPRQ